jgi:hypothetical protein
MFGKNRALEMYHALRSYKRITSREVIDALYTEFIPWQELITQGFSRNPPLRKADKLRVIVM